jgi:hypothetical protein
MNTKPGVDLDHLHPIVQDALPIIEACRLEALERCIESGMTITAGAEGTPTDHVHSTKSYHYPENCPTGEGLAVDGRTKDYAEVWAELVRQKLGKGWDIIVEGDHLHCERDPKKVPLERG